MPWTRLQLQTGIAADLGGVVSDDNEYLTAANINEAIALAEQDFADQTHLFRRTATMTSVDDQAVYVLPEDCVKVNDITWNNDTSPLNELKFWDLRKGDSGYRVADEGTPRHWLMESPKNIRLYPPPEVDNDAIGTVITSIARDADDVITIATSTAHGLAIDEEVTVVSCSTFGLNGDYTVASVPTTTTFTTDAVAGDTESDTDGYVYPQDPTFALDCYHIPLSIGGSVSSIARASDLMTISTASRHGLRVGDAVTVSGCTTSGLDGALTVYSVTNTTQFTALDEGSDESDEDGYLYYTGGFLPMMGDSDVSQIPHVYQMAIRHYAVAWLARVMLSVDEHAQVAGPASGRAYSEMVSKCTGDLVL